MTTELKPVPTALVDPEDRDACLQMLDDLKTAVERGEVIGYALATQHTTGCTGTSYHVGKRANVGMLLASIVRLLFRLERSGRDE